MPKTAWNGHRLGIEATCSIGADITTERAPEIPIASRPGSAGSYMS